MTKGENRISSYSSNGYELSPDDNDDAPNAKDGFGYDDFQHCRLNSIFLLPNNDFKWFYSPDVVDSFIFQE